MQQYAVHVLEAADTTIIRMLKFVMHLGENNNFE